MENELTTEPCAAQNTDNWQGSLLEFMTKELQNERTLRREAEAKLEEKMERWVYLTELKEKIDAQ